MDLDHLAAAFEADGLEAQVFPMGTQSFVLWLEASQGAESEMNELCARARHLVQAADDEASGVILLAGNGGVTRCKAGPSTVRKAKSLDDLLRVVREADSDRTAPAELLGIDDQVIDQLWPYVDRGPQPWTERFPQFPAEQVWRP